MLKQQTIEKALNSEDARIKCVGVGNCKANLGLTHEYIDKLRKSSDPCKRQAAMLACHRDDVPYEWVLEGLRDYDFLVKDAAARALEYHSNVPVEQIEKLLCSELWHERYAGVNACIGSALPVSTIREWAGFSTLKPLPAIFRDAAAAACIDNASVHYRMLERIMHEAKTIYARRLAARAFYGREVPAARIVYLLHRPDECMQLAGLYAYSTDKAVPYIEIGEKLISENVHVRRVASTICDKSRLKTLRVIEPTRRVYKKCANGVIVVASIPEIAQVRGNQLYGYRTNTAVIEDVIGNFCGEPVGVSLYDHAVEYHIGDIVEIKDFDFSYEPKSTGFHFFNEFERAKSF